MFKQIIAAIDFSPAWTQLQAHLERLPRLGCQRVTLVYVMAESYAQAPQLSHAQHYESRLAEAAEALRVTAQIEVDWALRGGPVVPELIAAAAETRAEALLVGSQGHGVLHDLLLGRTALDLVRLADRPVLLAPINGRQPEPMPRQCRPLLATDGSAAAAGAEALFLESLPHCARGAAVSVGPWQECDGPGDAKACIERHLDALLRRVGTADPFDVVLVEQGQPSMEIVRVAEEQNADMIIIGRRGHNRLQELLLGSTAEGVCRASQRLVVLVPATAS